MRKLLRILLLVFVVIFAVSCGTNPTATSRPAATREATEAATEAATEEATAASAAADEATEEATEEMTEEATEAATEEMATPEPTDEATEEATESAAAEGTEVAEATTEGTEVAAATAEGTSEGGMTTVRLQLKWVTQAQFAGYYAALEQGYYADEGLDVQILPGGPDIGPQQVVAAGGAEFGIDWMGSMLASREEGTGAVNIAQVFQRSGMRELTWADSGLETIEDLRGRVVGVWGFGNQYPLFAALVANGMDPDNPDDVTIFNQPFDMVAFLNREIDAAAAMTYNEMAQVLEAVGEDGTFPLYTMEDLNVIDLNEVGTAMLEDLIFANEEWLAQPGNEDIAERFLRASFRGWTYCRDNADQCVEYVLAEGSTLGEGHQRWMMNEINKLIWPSPNGIGQLDTALYQQTAEIAQNYDVISAAPDEGAVRTDLAEAALAGIIEDYPDADFMGLDWQAAEVEITPNGE